MSEKKQNKTKQDLKRLIETASYLPEKEKEEWMKILDSLNQDQINEVFKEIQNSSTKDFKFSLYALVKNGKGQQILSTAKEITEGFKKQALKKQETKIKIKEGTPEEILEKLNQS